MIQPRTEPLTAALFDLDGTLVDSMPQHYAAYAEVLEALGAASFTYAEFLSASVGPARQTVVQLLGREVEDAELRSIRAAKYEAFLRRATLVKPLPLLGLVRALGASVPIGLVTSAGRNTVGAILASFDLSGAFRIVVTGDDVARGKPHPEPYLLALEHFGLHAKPSAAIAFEDTDAGARSARAAGIPCVLLVNSDAVSDVEAVR